MNITNLLMINNNYHNILKKDKNIKNKNKNIKKKLNLVNINKVSINW